MRLCAWLAACSSFAQQLALLLSEEAAVSAALALKPIF
jgi:hypothetical protein